MPLDTIYLTRHGHRLNWTIDYKTGTYSSQFPTPTRNPSDPTLTSHGVRQSNELAAHILSENIHPKPFRVYSSPFYRCIQTITPTVEALKKASSSSSSSSPAPLDKHAEFDIRIENGVGEWFGHTTFFHHPTPPTLPDLTPHFKHLHQDRNKANLYTSTRGETIAQLHDRLATALASIIAEADEEIAAIEAAQPPGEERTRKAVLICSHAAPLIAIGRALTGRMPEDSSEEDFYVYTAGLSTFRRREGGENAWVEDGMEVALAPGTRVADPVRVRVPDWRGGKGVGGGWDCMKNGDCSFLSGGAERGWHFNGEEGFDTGPMTDGLGETAGMTKL